jgi:peptidyl-dipeptidase Dcp
VGRGARRRRLRGLRRSRQPVRRGRRQRLFRFIYSSGNSIEPGAAYRAFRGRAPTPQPMLKQRGLAEEGAPA